MVDFLVAATLSNLLVSTILAVLAWVVQRRTPSPGLTNLLWAVVLIKMVTPPIVAIPALTVPSVAGSNIPTRAAPHAVSSPQRFEQMNVGLSQQTSDIAESTVVAIPMDEPTRLRAFGPQVVSIGIVVWVVVSAILFVVSAARFFGSIGCSWGPRVSIRNSVADWRQALPVNSVCGSIRTLS